MINKLRSIISSIKEKLSFGHIENATDFYIGDHTDYVENRPFLKLQLERAIRIGIRPDGNNELYESVQSIISSEHNDLILEIWLGSDDHRRGVLLHGLGMVKPLNLVEPWCYALVGHGINSNSLYLRDNTVYLLESLMDINPMIAATFLKYSYRNETVEYLRDYSKKLLDQFGEQC